jgi:hypothetical protein
LSKIVFLKYIDIAFFQMDIKHTKEFDLAYRFVTETNLNIFLTGKAGTGKTTFLKYLRENSFKKMVVAAPTGVAAINAGGVTLHSLFQLPLAPFVPVKSDDENAVDKHSLLSQIRFNRDKINLFRSLELLVIDEASMVACDKADAIDTILRSVRRRHRLPFGGVQVLFIGDMHQLQPVVTNHEWEILKTAYSSRFFFDSFVLKENIPVMIELKEIFRQRDDTFIGLLNEIRSNSLTPANFSLLNSRLKADLVPADNDGYIILTTHNAQADRINEIKLRKLQAPSEIYEAEIKGDFAENLYPADSKLELKTGARVMFMRNDTEDKKYFNGKTGVVTELTEEFIKVKCDGENEHITVKKFEWENTRYKLNKETRIVESEVLGSFIQYPLRLAWAITIHKSQGLTFDRVVIDAANAFANGQVYVALSRCTTLEGLVLTTPVNRQFLGAHRELQEWTDKNDSAETLPVKFMESRRKFARQELENIFTWNNWLYELQALKDAAEELKEDLPETYSSWMSGLIEKQKLLNETAEKFKGSIEKYCSQNPLVEENADLQTRVKAAANYFSAELKQWKEKFSGHPFSTSVKKEARKIDTALNDINGTVEELLHKLNHCKNGFLLSEYLRNGKKLNAAIQQVESSYAQNKIRNMNSDELEHAELYERIAEMRKRLGNEANLPLYIIFTNNVIKNICVHLPGNTDSLLKISGFGKAKVKKYGDELLEIVNEYCTERNILIRPEVASLKRSTGNENKRSSGTIEESVRQFRMGRTIEQIASERKLVTGTIESHLALAIRNNVMRIEECMSIEEARRIAAYFPTQPDLASLASIKEKAPAEVSYGKLRMVLEWLCRKEVK